MRVKALLTLASCSLISLGFSGPSIAEAVKDSEVRSTPTGIVNLTQVNETTSVNGNDIGGENIDEYHNIEGDNNSSNTVNPNIDGNIVCQVGKTCNHSTSQGSNNYTTTTTDIRSNKCLFSQLSNEQIVEMSSITNEIKSLLTDKEYNLFIDKEKEFNCDSDKLIYRKKVLYRLEG